jgi:hypothetical protein
VSKSNGYVQEEHTSTVAQYNNVSKKALNVQRIGGLRNLGHKLNRGAAVVRHIFWVHWQVSQGCM